VTRPATAARGLAILACLGLATAGGGLLGDGAAELFGVAAGPDAGPAVRRTLVVAGVVYALLMAVPFVPGIELGLALLAAFGPPVVALVYGCTLAGLVLSFAVGRAVPAAALARGLAALSLHRAAGLVRALAPMSRDERIAELARRGPGTVSALVLRHRHLALAALLNLPGNILLGGGGGLAMLAGISRLVSPPAFVATVALATSPVPLAVLLVARVLADPR